jgi:hypothetical protein
MWQYPFKTKGSYTIYIHGLLALYKKRVLIRSGRISLSCLLTLLLIRMFQFSELWTNGSRGRDCPLEENEPRTWIKLSELNLQKTWKGDV